ncbi:MAG: hypothetical protein FDZ70_10225 [Actinobacteria bacterium]|nr:MAG: hypothetical protein FDZ70_10225 [Actinomycetota bacterium]
MRANVPRPTNSQLEETRTISAKTVIRMAGDPPGSKKWMSRMAIIDTLAMIMTSSAGSWT